MQAICLRTEYLNTPIGIDMQKPRLFWNCDGGIKQTAYEIQAWDDQGKSLWSSEKVLSRSMRCVWGGGPVAPKTRVRWQIRLWDEADQRGEWSESSFETGIDTWKATWITGNYKVDKKQRYSVDCFRKCFDVTSVARARLYITACGLYEAKLNGQKCGNFVMAPGHTDYRKRVQYQTYDVTELLTEGENELTVQLADGWFRGSCGAWGIKNQYGTQTKLLIQLEITRTDGSIQTILSDKTWQWSNDGPIRFADNKDGEIYDAAAQPSYRAFAAETSHPVIPTASNNVPVTEHEHFCAKLLTTPSGKTVLDFGQNMAGYVSFRLEAKAGQKITLRFGEMLDAEGEFTQKNIQLVSKKITTPLQQVVYTCKEGLNTYKTTFAVFGFQYVQVEADFPIDPAAFTAIAVYSDLEQTGFFDCSHPLLNALYHATLWSAKGNHLDVPTDCPTRERHGWSGDAQIFCDTASYMFRFAPFAKKYLHDMYDWQDERGCLPHIAPEGGADSYMRPMNGSVGWADAGIIIPYQLSRLYGDDSILEELYDDMARYARFMESRCGKSGFMAEKIKLSKENRKYLVNSGQSYGEWAEPEDVCSFQWQDFVAPHPEVSTAYTAYVLGLMASIAQKLGKRKDAKEFRTYSEGCKKAYQELVSDGKYTLDTDRQAQLVRPLAFNLLTDEQTVFARKRLITALKNYGWRLGTGFLSTPLILDVLTQIDLNAAYRLLENEQIPGWLSMPRHGATTIWENWSGPFNTKGAGAGSLNHYSKGAVCRWLFDTMCGIRMNGENRFVIAPRPGGSLTHAHAAYESIYGKVESKWVKTDEGFTFTVTVPANCEATVLLPDGSEYTQAPGTTVYQAKI